LKEGAATGVAVAPKTEGRDSKKRGERTFLEHKPTAFFPVKDRMIGSATLVAYETGPHLLDIEKGFPWVGEIAWPH